MNRNRKNHLFLLLLLAGIFYACLQNDLFENQVPLNLPPEIAVAKQWYETEIGGNALHWRMGGKSSMLEADWQNAFAGNHTGFRIIEVPLKSETPFYRMISEVAERAESTGDRRYMASATRLLIRTCFETNVKDAFVMVVSPDLDYLTRNLDNPLRNFTYINRGEFSGLVFFYNLAGKLASGFHITGGEAFRFFSEASMANQPQLRASGICTFRCTTTRHYNLMSDGTKRFIGTSQECVLISCISTDIDGGGEGGPGAPGTGGQQPLPRPPLDEIFRRGNMTNAQWAQLERLYQQVGDNCVGNALLNGLARDLEVNDHRLGIQSGAGNSFNPNTGMITMNFNISNPDNLFHEMFHALQAYGRGIATPQDFGAHSINFEMEARFAQYAFLYQASNLADVIESRGWDRAAGRYTVMELNQFIDHRGWFRPGADWDIFNHHITSIVRPALERVPGHQGLVFNPNKRGVDNFANIRRLNIDC